MATQAEYQGYADAVEAAIQAFIADGAIQQYTTPGGVTVQRAPIGDLLKLRDDYLAKSAAARTGGATNYFRRGTA